MEDGEPSPRPSRIGRPQRARAAASPSSGRTGSSRGAPARASKKPQSRGAGRTGAVRRDDEPAPKREKGLGGTQIEGRQAVRELLLAGKRKVHEIWISSELAGRRRRRGHRRSRPGRRACRCSTSPANGSRRQRAARRPRVCSLVRPSCQDVDFAALLRRRKGVAPFYVAIDGVTDPGNLGAIVRSCDGAGVDAVIVPRHRAVHVTPTVAKASAGAVEHVPISIVGGLPTALARLRDAGVWVVGLDDAADRDLFDIGDLAVEGICIVLGAEGAGLLATRPRALRHGRVDPDARPAELAQRLRGRRPGHLRGRPPPPSERHGPRWTS